MMVIKEPVSLSAVLPNNLSQLSSGDASDSICPKGWGMAGVDGDGSYEKLISNIYDKKETKDIKNSFEEYQNIININSILLWNLLSFNISGYYRTSGSFKRLVYGIFKEKSAWSKLQSTYLSFTDHHLYLMAHGDYKNYGHSVRCEAK